MVVDRGSVNDHSYTIIEPNRMAVAVMDLNKHRPANSSSVGVSNADAMIPVAPEQRKTAAPTLRPDAPLRKLTKELLSTYKKINQIYYARKKQIQQQAAVTAAAAVKATSSTSSSSQMVVEAGPESYDDENYDYRIRIGEVFNERFVIDRIIGKGSFGQVVKAFDQQTNEYVAIKVIKSKKPFRQQAKTEITILEFLNSRDPKDNCFVVRLRDQFMWRNHQCLVFEMLSYNLYELLRNTHFTGVSLPLIRKFARQLLNTLDFLSSPDVNVIHCDLKPENIMLRHPKRSAIKVIDFGSSCFNDQRMYSYIQSRFYRSPEVLLGLPYSVAIDMWSLGCILVEMHTGEPLFSGQDEVEQVGRICDILGMPPVQMITASPKAAKYFSQTIDLQYRLKRTGRKSTFVARPLADILGVTTGGPNGRRQNDPGHSEVDYLRFKHLIERMLDMNPQTRITPAEALRHSFFRETTDEAINTVISCITPSIPSMPKNNTAVHTSSSSSSSHSANSRVPEDKASHEPMLTEQTQTDSVSFAVVCPRCTATSISSGVSISSDLPSLPCTCASSASSSSSSSSFPFASSSHNPSAPVYAAAGGTDTVVVGGSQPVVHVTQMAVDTSMASGNKPSSLFKLQQPTLAAASSFSHHAVNKIRRRQHRPGSAPPVSTDEADRPPVS
eukprot:GILK01003110.1.p1 GENE.GILK01003110.1~~GILK01003110.1.p1  ORF type:complete len:669 (+),score=70.76 GILK01003110.1:123-2129(+)